MIESDPSRESMGGFLPMRKLTLDRVFGRGKEEKVWARRG
jgi:hypothetical protein